MWQQKIRETYETNFRRGTLELGCPPAIHVGFPASLVDLVAVSVATVLYNVGYGGAWRAASGAGGRPTAASARHDAGRLLVRAPGASAVGGAGRPARRV